MYSALLGKFTTQQFTENDILHIKWVSFDPYPYREHYTNRIISNIFLLFPGLFITISLSNHLIDHHRSPSSRNKNRTIAVEGSRQTKERYPAIVDAL